MTEETKSKKARYISKFRFLKLINKSSYSKEVNGRVVVVEGSSIQFNEGLFETSDSVEIKFLDNHPNFGDVFLKIKDKDIEKARENQFKHLTVKQQEERDEEEKKELEKKALGEGEGLPKKKGEGKSKKSKTKEKPAF